MRFSERSLFTKVYIALIIAITIPMAVLAYMESNALKERIFLEKERTLYQIISQLEQQIPKPYNEILHEEGALSLDPAEQRNVLRKRLQPIISELEKEYPGYLFAYGDYEYIIAAPSFFNVVPTSSNGKAVYEQKKIDVAILDYSAAWGTSCLAIHYPLMDNGQVYGHVGASTRLSGVESAYRLAFGRNLLIVFFTWLVISLVLRKALSIIREKLNGLARQIKDKDDSTQVIEDLPELAPVLNTVIELRNEVMSKGKRIENLLEHINEGFCALDKDATITYMNSRAKEYFGRDLTGQNAWLAIGKNSPFYEMQMKAFEKRTHVTYEAMSTYINRWVETSAYPTPDGGLSVFFWDIHEKKQMQEQLARLDELNVVSKIAASISHEVRNPLTSVRGFLQFLGNKSDTKKYHSHFELMIDEIDRATAIIEEFLSASRINTAPREIINLNTIITTLQPLLEADALKTGHELEVKLDNRLPDLVLSKKEIKQMVLNLTRNAFEAMRDHGKVVIETLARKDEVQLIVKDTGKGILPEIISKLGKPFVTTKETGTGLGLAVCYGVAEKHGAEIHVDTCTNGTTFTVRFPLPSNNPSCMET